MCLKTKHTKHWISDKFEFSDIQISGIYCVIFIGFVKKCQVTVEHCQSQIQAFASSQPSGISPGPLELADQRSKKSGTIRWASWTRLRHDASQEHQGLPQL